MGVNAVVPEQVVNVDANSVLANITTSTGSAQAVALLSLMAAVAAIAPTTQPSEAYAPWLDTGDSRGACLRFVHPGLSGSWTCDSTQVTADNATETCDRVDY